MEEFVFEFYNAPASAINRLSRYGTVKVQEKYTELIVEENNVRKVKKKSHGLKYICYRERYGRSSSYRDQFFRNNMPVGTVRGKPYWRCRYCNRKITKSKVEVDHVIPVYKAKRSRKWQRRLPNGVNSLDNMVPSCRLCNRLKGTQTGLWVWRARWGKHPGYWRFIRALKMLMIVLVLSIIFYLSKNGAEIGNHIISFFTNSFSRI